MTVQRTLVRGGLLVLLLFASAGAAEAQCSISATPVSFGAYDVLAASPKDSTGTVTFNCSLPVSVTVDLNKGVNSTTFLPRKMSKGSGSQLQYNLYMDASRTIVWGDASAGTSHYTASNTPTLTNVVLTVYGRIPALVDVAAGSFTDTVVATIIF